MEKQQRKPGRPKTKHYTTLMARIPDDLVERVQQYAAQHQLNTSALIRDALECYISNEDILSYRYRNMSDINETLSDTSEESVQPALVSVAPQHLQELVDAAVQRALGTVNGMVTPAPEAPTPVPEHVQDQHTGVQDGADQPAIPPYDTSKFSLGDLCGKGHAYPGTRQSLRRVGKRDCVACESERKRRYKSSKRQGQAA